LQFYVHYANKVSYQSSGLVKQSTLRYHGYEPSTLSVHCTYLLSNQGEKVTGWAELICVAAYMVRLDTRRG